MREGSFKVAEHGHAPNSPCPIHDLGGELLPPAKPEWGAVQVLRQAQRAELLARRRALGLHDRKRYAESLTAHLLGTLHLRAYTVLGFYWPIRGELDLRSLARRYVDSGGIAALPVVVEKNAPVEFWQWKPGATMQRGLWNIPAPAERRVVVPNVLLIPLVGYDAAGYRLGYGGGYYDRTLGAAEPRPLCVGVGYDEAEVATIHPQPHDVPMDLIVTEQRVLRVLCGRPGVTTRPRARANH
jgi:5-formyltetrahydrofolate cyclo-ligase